jgi:hypothetical protein
MAVPQLTANGWLSDREPTESEPTGTREDGVPIRAVAKYDLWTNSVTNGVSYCINATPGALVWNRNSGLIDWPVLPVVAGLSVAGSGNYSVQIGKYQLVGNKVDYGVLLTWTGHTGTGNMEILNLPVNALAAAQPIVASMQNIILPLLSLVVFAETATTKLRLLANIAGSVQLPVQMSAAGTIRIMGYYFI